MAQLIPIKIHSIYLAWFIIINIAFMLFLLVQDGLNDAFKVGMWFGRISLSGFFKDTTINVAISTAQWRVDYVISETESVSQWNSLRTNLIQKQENSALN